MCALIVDMEDINKRWDSKPTVKHKDYMYSVMCKTAEYSCDL